MPTQQDRQPDVDRKRPPETHPSLPTRIADDVLATRAIAKEDLRMLLEKVTGISLRRAPGALASEQATAERAEHDRGSKDRSAYEAPGAPPKLARPVLMIPGLTMDAASFDPMTQQLGSTGANGEVAVYDAKDHHFHLGGAHGPVVTGKALAGVHMFQLQYIDPNAAPSVKQAQVGAALAAIQSATGAGTIDVVTHSAGGTDFRTYLEDRDPAVGPKIGNAVMIGPASHGTAVGNLGAAVGKPIGLDKAGAELAMGSKLIELLNKTWDHQRDQITGHITIVAIGGAPTIGPKGITDGDGYMAANQAGMAGAETVYLHGLDKTAVAHLREVEYSGVISVVQEALARGAIKESK